MYAVEVLPNYINVYSSMCILEVCPLTKQCLCSTVFRIGASSDEASLLLLRYWGLHVYSVFIVPGVNLNQQYAPKVFLREVS